MADRQPSLSDFSVEKSFYPQLWENCVGAWAPSLGPTGGIIPDRTGLTIPAEVVSPSAGTNYQVNDGVYCFDANVASSTYVKTNLNRNNTVTQLTWAWFGRLHPSTAFYVSDLSVARGFGIDNLGTLIYLNYPGASNYAQIGIDVRGRWVHYAYVFNGNGSTDAERIRFYIDGTERTLTYIGATPTSLLTTTEPLQIGRRPYAATQAPGLWDDFRAYSTALDPATIRLLASQRGIAYTPRRRRVATQIETGNSGDLSVTLGAATLSSSATVAAGASGNLSVTLGEATLSSTGTVTLPALTGDLSVTLGAATLSSRATFGPEDVEQPRGGYGPPTKRKQRDFDEERRERNRLREQIEAAVAPLKAKKAEVVETAAGGEEGVAILTRRQRVAIPVPASLDAGEVARMVSAALERAGIQARRAESERARQLAAAAFEAEVQERMRRIQRRRREEWLLLLN